MLPGQGERCAEAFAGRFGGGKQREGAWGAGLPLRLLPRAWARFAVFCWLAITAAAGPGRADTDAPAVAAICEMAAQQVSREIGVPLSVLQAISLTETGRTRNGAFRPWPWTVNMEGTGRWFSTRTEAEAYVDRHFVRGARSFDVGCFQINYRWHGAAFASVEEMFDPLANARYAARFLRELHAEFGDWSKAAGAYHSRTPRHATRYRARFDRIRARLGESPPAAETVLAAAEAPPDDRRAVLVPSPPLGVETSRPNRFPLLRTGNGARGIGSLVPLGTVPATGRRLIDGPRQEREAL